MRNEEQIKEEEKEMTVMCVNVGLSPGVNMITGLEFFPMDLVGKHAHLRSISKTSMESPILD